MATDKLKSRATGSQKNGAPTRRNQAGSWSSPTTVGQRWSRISKTFGADITCCQQGSVVCLSAGGVYWLSVDIAA